MYVTNCRIFLIPKTKGGLSRPVKFVHIKRMLLGYNGLHLCRARLYQP